MSDRMIPVTRVAFLSHYAALAESLGAPVERPLAESAMPEELLDYPAALPNPWSGGQHALEILLFFGLVPILLRTLAVIGTKQ